MVKAIEKEIEVEVIRTKQRQPDPNCSMCHGSGLYHQSDLICPCTIEFLPAVKEMHTVKVRIGD